ncbi:Uncharacterised protein [Yersinia frederiksenii]|nr:Uncharacterised protein [Yersinia frederiksenii]
MNKISSTNTNNPVITLSAISYFPNGFDKNTQYPVIIVSHPGTQLSLITHHMANVFLTQPMQIAGGAKHMDRYDGDDYVAETVSVLASFLR